MQINFPSHWNTSFLPDGQIIINAVHVFAKLETETKAVVTDFATAERSTGLSNSVAFYVSEDQKQTLLRGVDAELTTVWELPRNTDQRICPIGIDPRGNRIIISSEHVSKCLENHAIVGMVITADLSALNPKLNAWFITTFESSNRKIKLDDNPAVNAALLYRNLKNIRELGCNSVLVDPQHLEILVPAKFEITDLGNPNSRLPDFLRLNGQDLEMVKTPQVQEVILGDGRRVLYLVGNTKHLIILAKPNIDPEWGDLVPGIEDALATKNELILEALGVKYLQLDLRNNQIYVPFITEELKTAILLDGDHLIPQWADKVIKRDEDLGLFEIDWNAIPSSYKFLSPLVLIRL